MSTFVARLEARIREYSPLCVGLDPSSSTLAACGLPDTAEGVTAFTRRVLEASEGKVALVKPQSAYFERFGSAGWAALETTIAHARAMGVIVLLDAKRGDIDTTVEAYAQAFFNPNSKCRVDAVTVHPYLGFGALRKFMDYSVSNQGGVFVVVRSSNPEGAALQKARMANGCSVAEHLAQSITDYNREFEQQQMGPVGAVVGATCADADSITRLLPSSYILAPGVGAQGASMVDLSLRMPAVRGRILPSVSRGIIAQGTSGAEMAGAIRELQQQARRI